MSDKKQISFLMSDRYVESGSQRNKYNLFEHTRCRLRVTSVGAIVKGYSSELNEGLIGSSHLINPFCWVNDSAGALSQ